MATTSSTPQPSATAQEAVEEQRRPISLGRESGSVLVLLIFIAVLILTTNDFLTITNLDNLVNQVAVFAILSVGELFVILTGGIDLSVGSILGLSGGVTALILASGVSIPVAFPGDGRRTSCWADQWSACDTTEAAAIHRHIRHARSSTWAGPPANGAKTIAPLPDAFSNLANGLFLGLPNLFWILIIVTIIAAFVLGRTIFGRYVYAVGSNAESSRLSGVPVNYVLLGVYCISGLLAGFAGILTASRLGAGIPTAGTGYELQAIAGAVIGGASLLEQRAVPLALFWERHYGPAGQRGAICLASTHSTCKSLLAY